MSCSKAHMISFNIYRNCSFDDGTMTQEYRPHPCYMNIYESEMRYKSQLHVLASVRALRWS